MHVSWNPWPTWANERSVVGGVGKLARKLAALNWSLLDPRVYVVDPWDVTELGRKQRAARDRREAAAETAAY